MESTSKKLKVAMLKMVKNNDDNNKTNKSQTGKEGTIDEKKTKVMG